MITGEWKSERGQVLIVGRGSVGSSVSTREQRFSGAASRGTRGDAVVALESGQVAMVGSDWERQHESMNGVTERCWWRQAPAHQTAASPNRRKAGHELFSAG